MKMTGWRYCELFGIKPTGVKDNWDDCDIWTQALLLAYDQTRDHDETDFAIKLAGGD